MTNQQVVLEALRLADEYDEDGWVVATPQWCRAAVNELRRLAALVGAQQPAPSAAAEVENLRKALQFYADKEHFTIADDGAWDTVSGEPQNYWCDEEGTATVEDGTIARLALAGHRINFDADEAPQPSPTPQADSQPAPQGETNAQLDTDSNPPTPGQQRDVAGPVALGQPVGNGSDQAAGHTGAQGDKLLTVAERNIRSFLRSAVFKSESDREAALNCVDVLWEAARAPADSVTAAAATPTAASIAWTALRDLTDPLGEAGVKIMGHVRIYAQRQYEAGKEEADRAMRAQAAPAAVAGPSETPEGWRNQFAKAVYADLEAADNQDVPLEEYPTRILKALDSIVGPRHPTVIHWRNDAIQACIAIAYKYCRDPESFQYLKQDLQALIFAAPTTQAAHAADSVTAPAGGVGRLSKHKETE